MALTQYHQKRNFALTPEPKGPDEGLIFGVGADIQTGLQFVVQKHWARHQHFDLRLEVDGVMRSWALPHGPSLDPKIRRLAVATEDHPLDYARFEGVIPKDQYGGGTVMVWDWGSFRPDLDYHQDWKADLAAGKLKFRLNGSKLRGGFMLVRLKDAPNWLLIKEKGEGVGSLPQEDVSALTGRNRTEIEAEAQPKISLTIPKTAQKGKLPAKVSPMLAESAADPPQGDAWLHEIKFDGYRILARIDKGEVRLFTRQGHDWSDKFPEIARELAGLPLKSAWLDGEVVVLNPNGVSDFQALQAWFKNPSGLALFYQLFDLTHLNGTDFRKVPLIERKEVLQRLLVHACDPIRFTDHIRGQGTQFAEIAKCHGLEGVMSKRANSLYHKGRSPAWVKTKFIRSQEFLVLGHAPPRGQKTGVGSLMLGVWQDGEIVPAGKVGSGISEAEGQRLEQTLAPLSIPRPKGFDKGYHAVQPQMVVSVKFSEWSNAGALRHPVYMGQRLDMNPATIRRQDMLPVETTFDAQADKAFTLMQTDLSPYRITHPDRIIFPHDGITKAELAGAYLQLAPKIMPFIEGRALTILRFPDGLSGKGFFQRHPWAGAGAEILKLPGDDKPLIGIKDEAGLMALIQMGAVEIHSWGARMPNLDLPDQIVMDLDPDEGLPLSTLHQAVRLVADFMTRLGLVPFLKTTGGKGFHVVAPLKPKADWAKVKAFAKAMAEHLARTTPESFTANMSKKQRSGRIYLDFLRNQKGATSIAPYAIRGRDGAGMAVPLAWDELETTTADRFSLRNLDVVLRRPDPWADFFTSAKSLPSLARQRQLGLDPSTE